MSSGVSNEGVQSETDDLDGYGVEAQPLRASVQTFVELVDKRSVRGAETP
jgi:hypothetical protein